MTGAGRLAVIGLLCSLAGGAAAGEPVRLTHDGRLKFTPVFCDDGASLDLNVMAGGHFIEAAEYRCRSGRVECQEIRALPR